MTYAPATLTALLKYWTSKGGVNLGIVGNTAHTSGYHLGKDRIYDGAGPGQGANDYSVKTARDKAGLTNAASACDLGKLNGSLTQLWAFSAWLAKRCMANAADTKDVREIIFWDTKTGQVVGWSDLSPSKLIPGYGDSSHKTHTHISYYRDSEGRDKRPLFAAYPPFTTVAPPQEDTMPTIAKYLPGYTVTLKGQSNIRNDAKLSATLIRTVPSTKTETWAITGTVIGDKDVDGGCTTTTWYTRWNGQWEYTSGCNVIAGPTAPAGGPVDCSAETDPLKAQIASLEKQVADAANVERDRIADAEADRIKAL